VSKHLPPGGNPLAVNKYVSYRVCAVQCDVAVMTIVKHFCVVNPEEKKTVILIGCHRNVYC